MYQEEYPLARHIEYSSNHSLESYSKFYASKIYNGAYKIIIIQNSFPNASKKIPNGPYWVNIKKTIYILVTSAPLRSIKTMHAEVLLNIRVLMYYFSDLSGGMVQNCV